jgi:polyphosphate kinase
MKVKTKSKKSEKNNAVLDIPKEISWLSFNHRVLQEAANPRVPLLERLKFLGICSSNLDEFYRVRVASLRRIAQLGKKAAIEAIGADPNEILEIISEKTRQQHADFDRIYGELLEELASHNLFIVNEKEIPKSAREHVLNYFHQKVRSHLFPIMLDQVDEFPSLKDRAIYLAVQLQVRNGKKRTLYSLIEIPSDVLPRFCVLPEKDGKRYIMFLDDVIRHGMREIFSVYDITSTAAFTIKITRDAELEIDTDLAESYLKKVARSLKQREDGNPVRLIHDAELPKPFLRQIKRWMQIGETDTVIAGSRYHNNRDFLKFPGFGPGAWYYDQTPDLPQRHLRTNRSVLTTLRERDVLLHYPYQSFDYLIDLLREASIDPHVRSIKITVYRVAENSHVMNALINAVRNGKSVTVVLELQARFDEQANVSWADVLRDEGVQVIYGVPGLKVHAKLLLITSKEGNRTVQYAAIGTGNFNEDTARIYSDHHLLTSDHRLTGEVAKMFDFFNRNYRNKLYKHLIVSPYSTRTRLLRLIQDEIKNAQHGREAYIYLKLNNLTDREIIRRLYRAGKAGVQVRLIVRGMCSLVPGIKGESENIEAISIVDKYLEHSRIFIFANGGDEKIFITSADMMPRNLDRRVEVTCPVYDPEIKAELKQFWEIQWQDNVRARLFDPLQSNHMRDRNGNKEIRAQWAIYEYIKELNS